MRPVSIAARAYWHVVVGAKLLQELFIQELVDHLVCGAAFEVCRQNRGMVGSLRSRRQNQSLSIGELHKILLVMRHHRRHDRNPAEGASAGEEEGLKSDHSAL